MRPRSFVVLRRALACALALFACGGVASAAHAATPPLYVSLTFDDGLQDQLDNALPALNAQGFKGTFYLNSGKLGQPGYMSWAGAQTLQSPSNGMEIGGHTIDHKNLTDYWLKPDPAYPTDAARIAAVQHEVCDDRAALVAHGITPTSFAYPNGAFQFNDDKTTIPNIVKGCNNGNGYTSARTTSGIALNLPDYHCDVCYAPLSDRSQRPFTLRASQARGNRIAAEDGGGLPAEEGNDNLIDSDVLKARTNYALSALQSPKAADLPNPPPADGGWLVIVLHNVCANASAAPCNGANGDEDKGHSTTAAELNAYLAWLKAQTATGCVVVATVQEMMTKDTSHPGTCQPATDPGTGSGGSGGSGSGGSGSGGSGGAGSGGSGSGGSGGTGSGGSGATGGGTATTTPAPIDTPVSAPVDTPPASVPAAAASTSAPAPAAPTARLLAASSKLLAQGIVDFRAVVNAPAGVKRVEFLVNGKVVGRATDGPYRLRWSAKLAKGKARTVKVAVRVTDGLGRVTTSTPVTLKVRGAAPKRHH